jgi:hypothetical protein
MLLEENLSNDEKQSVMDCFYSLSYNALWQLNGPRFAGQPTAAVDRVPSFVEASGCAFPIFMKRTQTSRDAENEGTLLGWEYVGQYRSITDPDLVVWELAHNFSPAMLKTIAVGHAESAQGNSETYGNRILSEWRLRLEEVLQEEDPTPAGPLSLIEDRMPTMEERNEPKFSLAARA